MGDEWKAFINTGRLAAYTATYSEVANQPGDFRAGIRSAFRFPLIAISVEICDSNPFELPAEGQSNAAFHGVCEHRVKVLRCDGDVVHTSAFLGKKACIDALIVERLDQLPLPGRSSWNLRGWRPVGPIADPDEENRRPFFGIIRGHHRRARQIGSPALRRVSWNKKHQVRMPVFGFVAQVLLL